MAKRLLNEGGAYRVTGLFSFTDEWIRQHIAYAEDTIEAWEYEKKRRNIDKWAKVIADYLSDDENLGTVHYMLDDRNALFAGWLQDGTDVWLPAIGVKDSWCDDVPTDYEWIDAPIVNEYGDVMEDITFESSADVTYEGVKQDIIWILKEYDEMMSDMKDKVNQINLETLGSDEDEDDEEFEECNQPKLKMESIKRKIRNKLNERKYSKKLMKEGYGHNAIDADTIANDIFMDIKPASKKDEIDEDLESQVSDTLDSYFIYDSDIEDMCREYANDEYEEALSRALDEAKDIAFENAYIQILSVLKDIVDDWNDNVEEEPEEDEEEEIEEESKKLRFKKESIKNPKYMVYKIKWETDDENEDDLDLPKKISVSAKELGIESDADEDEVEDAISEYLLDEYGFLHNGFEYKTLKESRFYELTPNNGRQSFYGKARVEVEDNGDEILYSYNTPIIKKTKDGDLIRLYDDWSATTGRHIAAFCGLNKRQFFDVPYEDEDY